MAPSSCTRVCRLSPLGLQFTRISKIVGTRFQKKWCHAEPRELKWLWRRRRRRKLNNSRLLPWRRSANFKMSFKSYN
ncbi:hypothetical protein ABFX02_12G064200 [Erythranthe guttata]